MRRHESGNVLYYIMLAIVLLAALSLAISRGGRGSIQSLTGDRERLLATEIMGFGDLVSKATSQLRLRGVSFSQLSYAADGLAGGYGVYGAAPESEIFNPSGGAITYKPPPDDAMTAPGNYIFTAANEIKQVGTTCGTDACADLIMLGGPLQPGVCTSINSLLHIDNPSGDAPVDTEADITTLFAGGATPYSKTIGDDSGSAGLTGHTSGCFKDDASGGYYFYQVLQPR